RILTEAVGTCNDTYAVQEESGSLRIAVMLDNPYGLCSNLGPAKRSSNLSVGSQLIELQRKLLE
ncbi:hypothetical protein ABTP77_22185, partial [Acinetobacter baumannii]